MKDIDSRDDIVFLVDSFYKRVVTDELIGVFFTSIVKLDWDVHIPIMYDFWETTLLGNIKYKGNPMIKHIELNKQKELLPLHFDRWLLLWETTIKENFVGKRTDEAIRKANQIGEVMKSKIKQYNQFN